MRFLTKLVTFLLTTASQLPAQTPPLRLHLPRDGAVSRLPRPQHATCWTAPEVHFFEVAGSARQLDPNLHLVLLVNPRLWDDRTIGWFAQCIPPTVDRRGQFRAIGQVGSEGVPGGGWFAGQAAEVVVVATKVRPTPGAFFLSPSAVPGYVAASPTQRLHLVTANSFLVSDACDANVLRMTPVGAPALGNGRFGMHVVSPREGQFVVMGLGEPTLVAMPLAGGVCGLHLGDDPLVGAVGQITAGHWTVSIPIPNLPALRGRKYALQSVLHDEASLVAFSSGAWLVTPW